MEIDLIAPPSSDIADHQNFSSAIRITQEVFEEQLRQWDLKFSDWSRKNSNNPNQAAYCAYIQQYENIRRNLLRVRSKWQFMNLRLIFRFIFQLLGKQEARSSYSYSSNS